jgi:hypothetical protein
MERMANGSYLVERLGSFPDSGCECPSCGWRGDKSSVREVGACVLTPGDASPAGRCPKCMGLVYPEGKHQRQKLYAADLVLAVEALVAFDERSMKGRTYDPKDYKAAIAVVKACLRKIEGRREKKKKAAVDDQ